jgi:uncharacterized protein with beta-barrel porin domain
VTSHDQNDVQPRTIGRRRIIRSAATVAWAVPAISIATSVPAFAGTGCCDVSLTGSAQWRTGELNYFDIPVTITNGCSSTVTGLTVMLKICGVDDVTYTGSDFLPAGWSQGDAGNKKLSADDDGCYTLIFTSAATLGANGSTSVTFTGKTKAYHGGSRPAGSVTASVSSAGCTAEPVAIVLPAV